ncbi:LytR/AlgR family response regulator transcription factor [Croceitalea marina]|uniref:LytR/AlgR family response regulator transcription factor n=1 Tax=Croceitalea marina TaxID=1775166 RepID=A0ABW5N0A5_9FLAO
MKTIVIDDCKMQNLTTSTLVKNNRNLDFLGSYTDAKKGLAAVNKLKPDLLILDVEMPDLNGFDVLQNLEHDCQVIMYSTQKQYAFKATQFNQVEDFLTKPINKTELNHSVSKLVSNSLFKRYEGNFASLCLQRTDFVRAS